MTYIKYPHPSNSYQVILSTPSLTYSTPTSLNRLMGAVM